MELYGLLQDPAVATGGLPLVGAFVLAIVIRFGTGPTIGGRFAIFGVALVFLAALWLIEGPPPFPPVASKQKFIYIAGAAIAIGAVLDLAGASRTATKSFAALIPLAAVLWLAEPKLRAGVDVELVLRLLAMWLAGVFGLWFLEYATQTEHLRANEAEAKGGLHAPLLLMVAALAAGAISFLGAFIGMAQVSVAIGAGLGGFMVANYLLFLATGRSLQFGAMGVVGLGATWFAAVYVMALYGGKVDTVALAVLFAVLVADLFARRVRLGRGIGARIVEPVAYGAIVVLPAIIAVGLAYAGYSPGPGY